MIHLMRQFTVRTRMLAAVGILAAALVGVGGTGIVAQSYSRSVAASFIQNDFASMTQVMRLRNAMSGLRSIEKDMIINYGRDAEVAKASTAWKAQFE